MNSQELVLAFRPATIEDATVLRAWERQPHIIESGAANDDWMWETELAIIHPWRESYIATLGGNPIGFLEIIDPDQEPTHYWGDIGPGFRAIDIWIGEPNCIGRGYGTRMMEFAINLCFANPSVQTILLDPLASNTRAHRFYERLGFKPREHRGFGDDDCIVYTLARSDWAL